MQCQRCPCAPPLPALHARPVEFAGVESVKAPRAARVQDRDRDQHGDVTDTSDPCVRMESHRRRTSRRRPPLDLVTLQMLTCGDGGIHVDLQAIVQAVEAERRGNSDRGQHERALLAIGAAR